MKNIKLPNLENTEIGRSIYLHDRMASIRGKITNINALKELETAWKQRIEIEHVIVADEEMLLIKREGAEEGVAVALADIESGAVSLQMACDEVLGDV